MSIETIRTIIIDATILLGLGIGGWFVGTEIFAHEAGPSSAINVVSTAEPASATSGSLVVPRSQLSPFGQHSGLIGRQVLVGRVTEVGDGFFLAQTPIGVATFRFDDGSTFLLRLAPGSASDLMPGAAVAVIGEAQADGSLMASSVLILPVESRPSIQPPPPPAFGDFGQGDGEGDEEESPLAESEDDEG